MKQILINITNRLHFVFSMFFITATLMLLVTMVVSVYINHMEKAVEESTQKHLVAAARAASTFITVEELDLFHTGEDMLKPEWDSIRSRLMQFAEEYQVLYVYYWRYDDGQIQYIIDNDEDEEWMVTPDLYYNLDDDPNTAEAVPIIMAGNAWASDLGAYTATWDGLISGLAPVFNDDGTIYCAAGVDLSDEIILTQRNNIRIMRTVLIISFFLSVLSGFFGMLSYRKKAIQSENASKAKSRFLSTVSHEIRTPMNAIIGITQIELQKSNLIKEYATAFDKIYSSSISLLGTINDILDLSKIETGKLELNYIKYDLPSLIQDTVQLNIVRIGSKPIDFIVDIDPNLPLQLIGDELRIKQVLNNLLSNSIKYTDKGHVKLTVNHFEHGEDIMLKFIIEDTGQGMKKDDIARLFSEYLRFNIEVNRATEGTGIGLSITKNLVELMGGSIKAESEFGKGSIFTAEIRQKTTDNKVMGVELSQRLANFTYSGKKRHDNLEIVYEPMPYGKVLIVDDVETNLYVAEGIMSYYELQIETAISGFKAIEKIESGKTYDIIFMDHMMPLMDGIETTQKLREMQYKGAIVALTANALVGNEELFRGKGFNEFISKPIDLHRLNEVLHMFIHKKDPDLS